MASSKIVEIDHDGDVILVCGGGKESQKLLVNSVILTRASKVFKAMLSGRFKEGAQLTAATGLAEIALPDDDPETMETICRVLHFHTEALTDNPDLHSLLRIAILADKYACTAPLKYVTRCWILKTVTNDKDELHDLLAASYYLRDAEAYENISRKLVLNSVGEIKCNAADAPEKLKKGSSLYLLEVQRQNFLQKLATYVNEVLADCSGYRCQYAQCHYAEVYTTTVIQKLISTGLLANQRQAQLTLDQLLLKMQNFKIQMPAFFTGHYGCAAYLMKTPDSIKEQFRKEAENLLAGIELPCLACVRVGGSAEDAFCPHIGGEDEG